MADLHRGWLPEETGPPEPEMETPLPLFESSCKMKTDTIKIRREWILQDFHRQGLIAQSALHLKFMHNEKPQGLDFMLKVVSLEKQSEFHRYHQDYESLFYLSSEEHCQVKGFMYMLEPNGEKLVMFNGMISFGPNSKEFLFATLSNDRILCKHHSRSVTICCELELESLLLKIDASASHLRSHSLGQNLGNVFDSGNDLPFSDVVIQCGEESYSCHKFLLAARSTVFAAMFAQPMKESLENKIYISDAENMAVKNFLRFLYTDYVNDNFEDALSLLPLADKYDVSKLKTECEHIICNNIDISNVLDAIYLGHIHNSSYLYSFSVNFIVRNLQNLMDNERFNEMMMKKPEILMDILKKSRDEHK